MNRLLRILPLLFLAACASETGDETDSTESSVTSKPTRTVLLIPGTLFSGAWFDQMAARLKLDGFEPVVFVPPDMFTESLATGGQRIADEVQRQLQRTGEKKLHIVAECDGGVATRWYLTMLGGDRFVDQAITFVSAHHGTSISPLGSFFTHWQAMADITPGSPFLQTLNAAPFPKALKLTSIYTCHDELMYPYTTSVVDGATNVLFCNHYIDHVGGFWDPVVYGRILVTLRGQGGSAPTSY
jgi:triacylglycerol lipase